MSEKIFFDGLCEFCGSFFTARSRMMEEKGCCNGCKRKFCKKDYEEIKTSKKSNA